MKPDTLIDQIYRASFSPHTIPGWNDNATMRDRLQRAERFVLDDTMSTFLGDLSVAAFERGTSLAPILADQLRIGARAPFPLTWIEYDLPACIMRGRELLPQALRQGLDSTAEEMPKREGWLIEQHPSLDYAFRLQIFIADKLLDQGITYRAETSGEKVSHKTWTFPVCYGWTVDDNPLPWPIHIPVKSEKGFLSASELFSGVYGYHCDSVGLIRTDLLFMDNMAQGEGIKALVREWGGVLRRVWALLATLNDIPLTYRETSVAKGFVARGRYRKYLSHRTIRLTVPQAEHRKLARKLIAHARRKAHRVRGHWRLDHWHPPSKQCRHVWNAENHCELCQGRRLFIAAHQRGDASLGFVSHDYRIEHPASQPESPVGASGGPGATHQPSNPQSSPAGSAGRPNPEPL